MSKDLTGIDVVERELQELKAGIRESIEVLQHLRELQGKVADVVSTYNKSKKLLNSLGTAISTLEAQASRSLSDLAASMQGQEDAFEAMTNKNDEFLRNTEAQLRSYRQEAGTAMSDLQLKVELQAMELSTRLENQLENYFGRLTAIEGSLSDTREQVESQLSDFGGRLEDSLGTVDQTVRRSTEDGRRMSTRLAQVEGQILRHGGAIRASTSWGLISLVLVLVVVGAGAYWILTGALPVPVIG